MTENDIFSRIAWARSDTPVPYEKAVDFMENRARAISEGKAGELLWSLEHPALFTAGTSARPEHLTNPRNLPTHKAGRGGQWTYHGPGQRLVYVMLDLTRPHGAVPPRDLRAFVAALERWIIAALAAFDVRGETRDGRVGVWVTDPLTRREAKIAALGIRVSRWASWHGVSVNLDPDLTDFEGIVPCGISEFGVTSLARFQPGLTMADLDSALETAWADIFRQTPLATPQPEETGCTS
ncbi:lipoyl(octanoyl) transferase LipB [Acidomonas methanolica]|uniref:Octanoyltransferase n=3 Tax=Acidomonas methanolica TaxID=437 RepID=A0A023D4H1_ACIMT|nr:lipoyl(octanoyl) transferase LipB [Acidomonas methanolica]MBU2653222.1 lipoyl(octanoyl) transferase LipB [Acidomonas methanolica]TCS32171.1 lipoyl(octanoyl) transferase [Acidomonas methanolica]GAJ28974.1 lipoate-protein ligase B [Acidomonas methanolica NBRC 104435]GEK97605.1 octanoyltransferase [Acidomonas methanolica NBRC 104435]